MNGQEGTVHSINVSDGGVPKTALPSARVRVGGIEGDRQRDRRYHGGPERAVSLYSLDLIHALQAEGHPIRAGSIGENLTVAGLDWSRMVTGARLEIGEVVLEITRSAPPCQKIAGSFRGGDFVRVSEKVHPGWSRFYSRVLKEGIISTGDRIVAAGAGQAGGEVSGMESLSGVVARGLVAYYERVQTKIHALVDPLSADELWRRPFPFGNSVGHLLLHLTGNLRYYIGAQIAGTGYVRDRPREFADPGRHPREDVLRELDDAVALVITTLKAQSDADWAAAYVGVGAEDVPDRFAMFVRCAAHADHHAGQMIYLCKQLGIQGTGR